MFPVPNGMWSMVYQHSWPGVVEKRGSSAENFDFGGRPPWLKHLYLAIRGWQYMNDIESRICSCRSPRPWTTYTWFLTIIQSGWWFQSIYYNTYLWWWSQLTGIDGHILIIYRRGCWNDQPFIRTQSIWPMLMTKSFPLAHSAQDSPFSSSKSAIFRTVNPKDKPMALEKNHGMKQQLDDALSTIEDVLGNLRPFFDGKNFQSTPYHWAIGQRF